MKRYLFLFILLISTLCCKSQVSFLKEFHNYKIDTAIKKVVLFENKFYCLKKNSSIITIDARNNELDQDYRDNSYQLKLIDIYLKNNTLFGVNKYGTYILKTPGGWALLKNSVEYPPFYEDKEYIITSTCSGEWGGSLYFKNKKTNKIYECASQCTLNIARFDKKYIINAAIAHMIGFTNIFEVNDPSRLKLHNVDSIKRVAEEYKRKHKKQIIYVGRNESNSQKGTIQLVDTASILSLGSFVFKGNIYYLISKNYQTTFIASIKDNKLMPLDTLVNKGIWSDKSDFVPQEPNCVNYNGTTICEFIGEGDSGFVAIEGNKLTVYTFHLNF